MGKVASCGFPDQATENIWSKVAMHTRDLAGSATTLSSTPLLRPKSAS